MTHPPLSFRTGRGTGTALRTVLCMDQAVHVHIHQPILTVQFMTAAPLITHTRDGSNYDARTKGPPTHTQNNENDDERGFKFGRPHQGDHTQVTHSSRDTSLEDTKQDATYPGQSGQPDFAAVADDTAKLTTHGYHPRRHTNAGTRLWVHLIILGSAWFFIGGC